MHLYLSVTADELELPIFVTESAREMADKYGISTHKLYDSICRGLSGKRIGHKFIKVDIGEQHEY